MKASELIKELQSLIKEYGDLEVYACSNKDKTCGLIESTIQISNMIQVVFEDYYEYENED